MRRPGTGVAVVLAVLLVPVLLWPDGEAVRRVVVDGYVLLLERGMPQQIRPEHYAALLNVLAFVPLGWLGVAALRVRVLTAVLVLAGLSGAVELVQLLPVMERQASLLDVACNTAGAAVGAFVASRVRQDAGRDEVVDEPRDVVRDDLG